MREFNHLLALMKPYRWRVLLSILLGSMTVGANIGLFGTSGFLIASAALHPENVLLIWTPIVGVRFFGLSRGVFRYLERLSSHDVTFRMLSDLRVQAFRNVARLGSSIWQRKNSSDQLGVLISDIEQVQFFYLRIVAPVVVMLLTILLGTIILGQFDARMAIILCIALLVSGLVIPTISLIQTSSDGTNAVDARAMVQKQTATYLKQLMTILLLDNRSDHQLRIEESQQCLFTAQRSLLTTSTIWNGVIAWISRITMVVLLILAVPLYDQAKIQGVDIPLIMLISLACFEAVLPIPQAFAQWGQIKTSATRLFDSNAFDRTEESTMFKNDSSNGAAKVEFLHVFAHYLDASKDALSNVSFCIQPGERIAIVGESGAGKSSLLKVLMNDLAISNGLILINDINILNDDYSSRVNQMTIVPQHVYLFHVSVLDNIRIANAEASREDVIIAAKQANIHDRIMNLPSGYDTITGDLGGQLSGGERQRVGLARALLRKRSLLVFDEPLNGLDAQTAFDFTAEVHASHENQTLLWITHRFEGIELFERILVMHQGSLVEQGTHSELLQRGGYYSELRRYDRGKIRKYTN